MTPARPSAGRIAASTTLALLSIGILGAGSVLIGNAWSTPLFTDGSMGTPFYHNADIYDNAHLATVFVWPVMARLSVLCLAVATYLRGREVSRAMACWWLATFGLVTGLWLIVRDGWDLRPQLLALILGYAAFVWWFVLRRPVAPR